jgi:hypothetical protein
MKYFKLQTQVTDWRSLFILDKLFCVAALLWLSGEFLTDDILGPVFTVNTQPWLLAKLFSGIGFALGILFMISSAIYNMRLKGRTAITIICLGLLAIFCLVRIGTAAFFYFYIPDTLKLKDEIKATVLIANTLNSNLSLEQKANSTKSIAAYEYVNTGERMEYLTNTGEKRIFEPTPEDIARREERVKQLVEINRNLEILPLAALEWFAILVIGTVLGLVWPIRNTKSKSIFG